MPRKFRIVVNGEAYEVEVEECGTSQPTAPALATRPQMPVPSVAPVAPVAPVAKAAAPVPAPPKAPTVAAAGGGTGAVVCPMPGTVLDVKVKVGDAVKYGQPVLILEAMKMENEIAATADGTVREIRVTKGTAVNAGDVLVVIG